MRRSPSDRRERAAPQLRLARRPTSGSAAQTAPRSLPLPVGRGHGRARAQPASARAADRSRSSHSPAAPRRRRVKQVARQLARQADPPQRARGHAHAARAPASLGGARALLSARTELRRPRSPASRRPELAARAREQPGSRRPTAGRRRRDRRCSAPHRGWSPRGWSAGAAQMGDRATRRAPSSAWAGAGRAVMPVASRAEGMGLDAATASHRAPAAASARPERLRSPPASGASRDSTRHAPTTRYGYCEHRCDRSPPDPPAALGACRAVHCRSDPWKNSFSATTRKRSDEPRRTGQPPARVSCLLASAPRKASRRSTREGAPPRQRPKAKRGDTGLPAACARKGVAVSSSVQPTTGVPAGRTYERSDDVHKPVLRSPPTARRRRDSRVVRRDQPPQARRPRCATLRYFSRVQPKRAQQPSQLSPASASRALAVNRW